MLSVLFFITLHQNSNTRMNPEVIKQIKNTPIGGNELVAMLGNYKSATMKLSAMEHAGEVVRLKRGLYVVDGSILGFPPSAPICSNHIYGPSYVSLQWALSFYGLIPERVHTLTAITLKRSRDFENKLGYFTYKQVPEDYYPIGITSAASDGATFLIATPEKALCDTILNDLYVPNLSVIALHRYLEEDIRFDMDELGKMDINILQACAECGRKTSTINNLITIVKKYGNI